MEDGDTEDLRRRLAELTTAHRDLDDAINALVETGRRDMVQIQRLKRQKLSMKDEISTIENKLLPDIIA